MVSYRNGNFYHQYMSRMRIPKEQPVSRKIEGLTKYELCNLTELPRIMAGNFTFLRSIRSRRGHVIADSMPQGFLNQPVP